MDLDRFYYTQHSLKAFESCPLKFKKRYMDGIRWREPPDENVRKSIQLGRDFHLLAQRYFLGTDVGVNDANHEAQILARWMENLKRCFPLDRDVLYLPEYKIRMNSEKIRVEANIDLIIVKEGQVTLWDWKTGSMFKKDQDTMKVRSLKDNLQTMVYMYVLKEQTRLITEEEIPCERINMCYWQPEPTSVIADISYTVDLHNLFYQSIMNQIETIKQYDFENFNKSLYVKHCKFCEFNCFCNQAKVDYEAVYIDLEL